MQDPWLFLLIFTAVVAGWLLGRRQRSISSAADQSGELSPYYYKGLNYLLNDQPDGALDAFIEALEVNSDTLETHIAVGNLMRRKGEVERAIRIHQNLLARPSLPRDFLHQAHLELAKDFISAGLLDRAESLLTDLLNEAPELKTIALRHLLEIYQHERDWGKAIAIAKQLLPRKSFLKQTETADGAIVRALSHFHCELADGALDRKDFREARQHVKQALQVDPACVRASLLLGLVEAGTGHYAEALKALDKIGQQDPAFIADALPYIKRCYDDMNKPEQWVNWLYSALEKYPSATLMLQYVEEIRRVKGDADAADFISSQLKQHPSLRGLATLVELHINTSTGRARDNLQILQMLITQLVKDKPHYQCRHCGFAGRQLHWLCPGCQQWGEMQPIRGAEGD